MGLTHSPIGPSDGLVLCLDTANRRSYPGSGTSWFDLSGNGNHGVLTNGPTLNTGPGGGMNFDGVNDYIQLLPSQLSTFLGGADKPFSVCLWMKTNSTSRQVIIGDWNTQGANQSFNIEIGGYQQPNGTINIQVFTADSYLNLLNPIVINQWYHIVLTYDGFGGTPVKGYLNGIYKGQRSAGVGYASSAGCLTVLGRAGAADGTYFNGQIEDVRIYRRVLTPAEAFRLYEIKKRRFQ